MKQCTRTFSELRRISTTFILGGYCQSHKDISDKFIGNTQSQFSVFHCSIYVYFSIFMCFTSQSATPRGKFYKLLPWIDTSSLGRRTNEFSWRLNLNVVNRLTTQPAHTATFVKYVYTYKDTTVHVPASIRLWWVSTNSAALKIWFGDGYPSCPVCISHSTTLFFVFEFCKRCPRK